MMATVRTTVGGAVANILKTGGVGFSSLSSNPLPLPFVRTSSYSWSITATATATATARRRRRQSVRRLIHPSYCTVSTDATSIASEEEHDSNIRDAAHLLDLRVGLIVKAWRHPEADSLYVEEVDVGETEPRIICSGLVNYIPQHLLENLKVVVLANLKPRNMRGVKSSGMLLAASDASHQNVELLLPPHTSLPGQRVWFGSPEDQHHQPAPATPNQIQKKKIWELVQPHLKTDSSCTAMLGEHIMRTSAGVVICESLKNANIS